MGRLKGKARKEAREADKLPEKRDQFDETKEPYIFKDDSEDVDEDKRKTAMQKAVDFTRTKYFPDKTKTILSDEDIECLILFDRDNPNYVNKIQRGEDMSKEEKDLFTKAEEYFQYVKYDDGQEIVGLEVINDPSDELIAERFKEEGAEYLGGGQIKDASGNTYRPADSIITGKSSLPNEKVDDEWRENDRQVNGDGTIPVK